MGRTSKSENDERKDRPKDEVLDLFRDDLDFLDGVGISRLVHIREGGQADQKSVFDCLILSEMLRGFHDCKQEDHESPCWHFTIDNETLGILTFIYKPKRAMSTITSAFMDLFNMKIPSEVLANAVKESGHAQEKIVSDIAKAIAEDVMKYSFHAIRLLEEQIERKMEEALAELHSEVKVQALLKFKNQVAVHLVDAPKHLIQLALRGSEEYKKRRINAPKRGGKQANYSFSELPSYYKLQHQKWKKAKALYNSENLREIESEERFARVKAEYPDLPDDLIARLADLDIFRSSASHIAIEHAARLCGVPPERPVNSYTPTYLFRIMSAEKPGRRNS